MVGNNLKVEQSSLDDSFHTETINTCETTMYHMLYYSPTYVTKDHCLSNTDRPIKVRESIELVFLALTLYVKLFDVSEALLISLKSDYDWVRNHTLGKLHHQVVVRC